MRIFESRLFWPKYRELLNSTGRLCIRRGIRPKHKRPRMRMLTDGVPSTPFYLTAQRCQRGLGPSPVSAAVSFLHAIESVMLPVLDLNPVL